MRDSLGSGPVGMKISTPLRSAPIPATPTAIAEILAELPDRDDPFAILGGDDEQRYMQALWTPDGFVLEYQEGNIDSHYRCFRQDLTLDEVTNALRSYLAWNGNWRPNLAAELVDLRPTSFKVGFAAGVVAGWLRRIFRVRD